MEIAASISNLNVIIAQGCTLQEVLFELNSKDEEHGLGQRYYGETTSEGRCTDRRYKELK